ncbi:nickel pincer cofactor biosynthesis protein LarB [Desulfocastanea catecholica]
MNKSTIRHILEAIEKGEMKAQDALVTLQDLPFTDIGHTKIDNHRSLRSGSPEVIYGEHKTPQQVLDIFQAMLLKQSNILATRVSAEMAARITEICPSVTYNAMARTLFYEHAPLPETASSIVFVTAGTADLPVAEEARVTAQALGNKVDLISDVGVAGIHRLFACIDVIRRARVVVVIAGMEGALASVVAGLVEIPVIAVPTSVGYGASFGGLSALLAMLTSCANGVTVVNIDNGFGAAFAASQINHLTLQ